MGLQISKLLVSDMKEGEKFSFEEILSDEKINQFASLTGDFSPLHMNEGFAQSRQFKGRVVHGVLLAGLFSRLVGMHFPGENAILQSLNMQFVAPAYVKNCLRVSATVDQVSGATKTVVLKAIIERVPAHEILVRAKIQIGFTN